MRPTRANADGRLLERIAAPENLLAAWRVVRGNIPRYRRARSAGPDGITLDAFERDLSAQLGALRSALIHGRYEPQPPAVFSIRKRALQGGALQGGVRADPAARQVAVLNVADRVAQRAAQQVLEPLWEAAFLPCSYGFRPGRSTHDAVAEAGRLRAHGLAWLVDGDIRACFDSLDHALLARMIEARLRDRRVVDLLSLWIEQGVLQQGAPEPAPGPLAAAAPWGEAWHKLSAGAARVAGVLSGHPDAPEDASGPYYPYARGPFGPPDDDYPSAAGIDWNDYSAGDAAGGYPFDPRDPTYPRGARYDGRAEALRQAAASGLVLGAGWGKAALLKLGGAIAEGLKTSAGRELLRRGALAGGGAIGAALGVGAAALLVYRGLAGSPGGAGVGIIQGSPLSPLLANLYLHSFDVSMTRAGLRLVRFADDWVVCCPSEMAAERAYNQAVVALAKIRLKIHPEKTQIVPPGLEVDWLGERIPAAGGRRTKRGR